MGINVPVEDFPPKTNAIKVTITTPIPFMPALPTPNKKAPKKAKNQLKYVKWYESIRLRKVCKLF